MTRRHAALWLLGIAFGAGMFALGRLTATDEATGREPLGWVEDTEPEPRSDGPDASGPLLHPTERPPSNFVPVPSAPAPAAPTEPLEVTGAGEGARVHVKGGALKVVLRKGHYALVREGLWVTWHANGQKASEGTYRDGVPEGDWTRWHADGSLALRATYEAGKPVGRYRSFHGGGRPHVEAAYERGVLDGLYRRFHPNGQLQDERSFRAGTLHGLARTWHASGVLASEGRWEAGGKDGTWTTWDEQGTRRTEEVWRLGQRAGEVRLWDEHGDLVTPESAREKASVEGKYRVLLRTVNEPNDKKRYGTFKEYGWFKATSYAGVRDIPAGYWVYVYPTWFVWGEADGVPKR